MAVNEAFTGTASITVTENSCTTNTAGPDPETSDGCFQLYVDVNDMVAGDRLQIRLYEMVYAAQTQRLAKEWILNGVQAEKMWISEPFMLLHSWDFTLTCLAGTSITCLWSIRKAN